ncbi:UNVERIFIED_CONTAM: hypothetical protein K2H54_066668, partial [Gekko kuhli]
PSAAGKFGFESGEEDEGPGGSAQEGQAEAILQPAPRGQPGNPDIKFEVGDVGPQGDCDFGGPPGLLGGKGYWGDDGEVGPDGLPREPAGATRPVEPAGDLGKYGETQDSAKAQVLCACTTSFSKRKASGPCSPRQHPRR